MEKTTSSFLYFLRRGLAKSQGHVYLEKYTNLPGFRITTLAEKAHRMSTAVKMDK